MSIRGAKEESLADMATIAALRGQLIGYADLEAMYNAVVYHRRWWRRLLAWRRPSLPPAGEG